MRRLQENLYDHRRWNRQSKSHPMIQHQPAFRVPHHCMSTVLKLNINIRWVYQYIWSFTNSRRKHIYIFNRIPPLSPEQLSIPPTLRSPAHNSAELIRPSPLYFCSHSSLLIPGTLTTCRLVGLNQEIS